MNARPATPIQCLTVAGSDSGGGAGIQADLKTFAALGVYGLSVITAVTAQNTRRVAAVFELPAAAVRAQLEAVFEDFEIAAAKTGMLATRENVEAVAGFWKGLENAPPLIVDPVLVSTSGRPLLDPAAIESLRRELLPLAAVLTPNREEAELLGGIPIRDRASLEAAGRALLDLGPHSVVIKGGHLQGGDFDASRSDDFLVTGGGTRVFSGPRIDTRSTHGTGCTFSAAVCAGLGRGMPVAEAVGAAKEYLAAAIQPGLALGHGQGPADHFYFLTDRPDARRPAV